MLPPDALVACLLPLLAGPSGHCRNIDKAGGLDAYILGTSEQKLDSDVALQLKAQMLQQLATVAPKQQLQRLGASFAAQGVVVPSGSAGPTAAAQAPQQVQPVTS